MFIINHVFQVGLKLIHFQVNVGYYNAKPLNPSLCLGWLKLSFKMYKFSSTYLLIYYFPCWAKCPVHWSYLYQPLRWLPFVYNQWRAHECFIMELVWAFDSYKYINIPQYFGIYRPTWIFDLIIQIIQALITKLIEVNARAAIPYTVLLDMDHWSRKRDWYILRLSIFHLYLYITQIKLKDLGRNPRVTFDPSVHETENL